MLVMLMSMSSERSLDLDLDRGRECEREREHESDISKARKCSPFSIVLDISIKDSLDADCANTSGLKRSGLINKILGDFYERRLNSASGTSPGPCTGSAGSDVIKRNPACH